MNRELRIHTLLLIILLCLPGSIAAQLPPGIVSGRIVERVSSRPVAGAQVIIEDSRQNRMAEATTDDEGNYRLELPPGTYAGKVTASGFAPQAIGIVTVTARYNTIYDVRLDLQISEEIEVRGGYFTPTIDQAVSHVTLRRAEIRALPGTGGDILRTISSLPGVTAIGAQFGDLLVRGGLPGENLTFIDNIPIGDFTYFNDQFDGGRGGRAAILAVDVFDRMEFSAGGFGPRYGDRLSSALDIAIRQASRDRVQGSVFADSGVAGLSIEVPLGRRAGWFASLRRSYIDLAFEIFDLGDIGKPRNLDVINKVNWDLTPRHKLSLTALSFSERITIPLETAQRAGNRLDRLVTERTSDRFIFGATLSSTIGEKTLSNLTAWGIGEHNDGSFLRIDNRTLQRQRDLRESQFGIKEELTAVLAPRLNLSTGGGLLVQEGTLYTYERSPIGFSVVKEEYFAPTRSHRLRLDSTATAYGYAALNWQATPSFSVSPGIRVDRYGLTEQTLASPRISARARLAPRLALNLGWGIYRQPPTTFLLALAPENRDLQAQRSMHYIAGLEWLVREDTRITVETYRKEYFDLIVRPTLSSPVHFNTGRGEVRGVEVTAQKALAGWFSGQAAYGYTYGRQRFQADSVNFPRSIVRPHQLTLIGLTMLGKWAFASKFRVADGLPYSPLVPVSSGTTPPVTLYDLRRPEDRNLASLPKFLQLDLRVERRFNYRQWSFAPYLDMFNLTKHRNVTEVTWRAGGISFLSERTLIPIFGARIEF